MHTFLDNIKNHFLNRQEVRHAGIDKKLKDRFLTENKKSSSVKQPKTNLFQYFSTEKDFSLEITFNKSELYQK